MKIKTAWLFFEQSGTFKKAFKSFGIDAIDLDVLNNFGETDLQIDLFSEIEKAHNGEKSVFDKITKNDLIMAFFPCTYFSANATINMRGDAYRMSNWNLRKKIEYSKNKVAEMAHHYSLLCDFVSVCLKRGLRLIIENPYTQPHFLTQRFPLKPAFIDTDRSLRGDFFRKPTQFFFINCEPENNFVLKKNASARKKNIENVKTDGVHTRQELRSMISPVYANRFIREFLLDAKKPAVSREYFFPYATKQERSEKIFNEKTQRQLFNEEA